MFKPFRYLPALALAAGGIATSACASPLYQSRRIYPQVYEQRAYDNGQREGLAQGRDDARRGREFSYTRAGEYRDADIGYRRQDGNRDEYRRTFRQGFQAGYTEGYNQFARAIPRTSSRWAGRKATTVIARESNRARTTRAATGCSIRNARADTGRPITTTTGAMGRGTSTHESTGPSFSAATRTALLARDTDDDGVYRIAARDGSL